MRICSICQSGAVLDDVVLTLSSGGCICLGCYCRETGSARPMPAGLRHALEEALDSPTAPPATGPSRGVTAMIERAEVQFPSDWKPWWQTLPSNA